MSEFVIMKLSKEIKALEDRVLECKMGYDDCSQQYRAELEESSLRKKLRQRTDDALDKLSAEEEKLQKAKTQKDSLLQSFVFKVVESPKM